MTNDWKDAVSSPLELGHSVRIRLPGCPGGSVQHLPGTEPCVGLLLRGEPTSPSVCFSPACVLSFQYMDRIFFFKGRVGRLQQTRYTDSSNFNKPKANCTDFYNLPFKESQKGEKDK